MMEAAYIGANCYAIRPAGALGTCGWINGEAWTVVYITAKSAPAAMLKFHCSHNGQHAIKEQVQS